MLIFTLATLSLSDQNEAFRQSNEVVLALIDQLSAVSSMLIILVSLMHRMVSYKRTNNIQSNSYERTRQPS